MKNLNFRELQPGKSALNGVLGNCRPA